MRKNFLGFLLLLNAVALPLLYVWGHPRILHGRSSASEALAEYGQMPSFTLTDHEGRPFSQEEMKGGVWLANFIFTRCPNVCPLMSGKFAALHKTLPETVGFLSFSVDPEYDTPAVLKDYAQNYEADAGRWRFLTGEKTTVAAILKALHLGDGGDPSMHSLRFVLLDKESRVRGYYDSQDPSSLAKIKKDLESLT